MGEYTRKRLVVMVILANLIACATGNAPPNRGQDASGPADAAPDSSPPDAPGECSADADCNDELFCNGVETCVAGACIPGEMQMDGLICDDSNPCTTGDMCASGACLGAFIDCSDAGDMCNVGVCDETDGTCVPSPIDDATACNDADACTTMDVCTAGICAGAAVDCSDMTDMCNVGVCNEMDGTCNAEPVADDTACDDADPTTTDDVCTEGVCAGTPPWSGIRMFSNCTQTQSLGPSQTQCNGAYAGTTLEGEVTVTGGIQRWTVPVTGTYRIEAWGAQGYSAQSGRVGGTGARMRGDFMLTMGQTLDVLVGQSARLGTTCNGGGGGGSFIIDVAASTPLIIAGGGAGTRQSVDHNGCPGRTSERGGLGSGSRASSTCVDHRASTGEGGVVSGSSWGSAGGGFTGNGAADGSYGQGGRSYMAGGAGGVPRSTTSRSANGGFGGGGTGDGSCGGGGGGGYSGGDGGRVAGGGGSFNSGTTPDNSDGCGGPASVAGCSTRTGDGQVTIDLI